MTTTATTPEAQVRAKPETPKSSSDKWLEVFSLLIHDIESPLASVKYLLKLIHEGQLDLQKPLHQRMVASSKIAIQRAESIIFDIMAVAKAGRVGLPMKLTTEVFDPVVREAVLLASGSAQERGITITHDDSLAGIEVKIDTNLLRRVIDNLLYNAIRHTPDGGEIRVYAEEGNTSVFVHVKDGGPGLGDADPDKLFEKFGQLQLRAQGKHRGVGLGLYFCRLAAQGMGGTIMADDHPEGGAVFSIRLKKAEE